MFRMHPPPRRVPRGPLRRAVPDARRAAHAAALHADTRPK